MKISKVEKRTVPPMLEQLFGDKYCQISTIAEIKLKVAVLDVFRSLNGYVSEEIEHLTKDLPAIPQGVGVKAFLFGYESSDGFVEGAIETNEHLKKFITGYPKEWEIVKNYVGLNRQKGSHASGFIISDRPIQEFIPITYIKENRITQYPAKGVESIGALKVDFLGLNSLKDIQTCISLVQEKYYKQIPIDKFVQINGKKTPIQEVIPFKGELHGIWDLPTDLEVYRDIARLETDCVFQLDTPTAQRSLKLFSFAKANGNPAIDSIEQLAVFNALNRPGPIDAKVEYTDPSTGDKTSHNMIVEYVRRLKGEPECDGAIPELRKIIPETLGVIIYQESLNKIFKEFSGCTPQEAEQFRVVISKKEAEKLAKYKEIFMKGATERVGVEKAQAIFSQMQTFARYGFNKSHAVNYSYITYATAFLKHHFPVEWWCSVLNNADKDETFFKFWKKCHKFIDFPDVKKSKDVFYVKGNRIIPPLTLMKGLANTKNFMSLVSDAKDIDDLCRLLDEHITATGTWSDKATSSKKNGVKLTRVLKKASLPISNAGLSALVATGAMDSLFPKIKKLEYTGEEVELSTRDKLDMFAESFLKYKLQTTKKKPEDVIGKYIQMSDIDLFVAQKQLLPVHVGEIFEPIVNYMQRNNCGLRTKEGLKTFIYEMHSFSRFGKKEIRNCIFASDKVLSTVMTGDKKIPSLDGKPGSIAVPLYVFEAAVFTYQKVKKAFAAKVDVRGIPTEFICWFGTNPLPEWAKRKYEDTICVIGFEKNYAQDGVILFDIKEVMKDNTESHNGDNNEQ